MKKIKFCIFILLIVSFFSILFYGIFGTSISYLSSKEIKENRKLKQNLINELKINNVDTIYEKNTNTYYYMVSEDYENNMYVLNLELKNGYKYKIVGETLNIIKVDYSEPIDVIIYNDKYYYETKIQLTNLPLINIETETKITTNDTDSKFIYINQSLEQPVVEGFTKIHVRGASSKYLDKKSYKIEFYNKKFTEEKNILISDFYYGNAFILDALYRDPSKIRNVLSTEIWNDVSNDFSTVDVKSEYVELFINNEHYGLYAFTEPINRKVLQLDKSTTEDTSVVIKTNGWKTIGTNTDFNDIFEDSYLDYEIKYPNDSELFEKTWYNFLSSISNYYNPNVKNTDSVIKNSFNEKNYIDIIIFNSFTTNMDSCLKRNNYFYMKSIDGEVYIQPWDMEFSYGHYLDSEVLDSLAPDKIYCEFYHEDAKEINEKLINRYWKLRKNVLTKENFDYLLNKYENELNKGASLRDSKIWYEYDIEKEIEYVRAWLYERLEFFDEYVRGLENE